MGQMRVRIYIIVYLPVREFPSVFPLNFWRMRSWLTYCFEHLLCGAGHSPPAAEVKGFPSVTLTGCCARRGRLVLGTCLAPWAACQGPLPCPVLSFPCTSICLGRAKCPRTHPQLPGQGLGHAGSQAGSSGAWSFLPFITLASLCVLDFRRSAVPDVCRLTAGWP